jgi:GR25 family glycosyltransferase involved in LPS biosynthesis
MIKHAIMSIDDSRTPKKEQQRRALHYFKGVQVPCVNGADLEAVDEWLARHPWIDFPKYQGQTHGFTAKRGELGVWFSTINMWEYLVLSTDTSHLIVTEDDAIFSDDAESQISNLFLDVPSGFDFISLFIPENQKEDYYHFVGIDPADGRPDIAHRTHVPGGADMWRIDDKIARSYQNYSNVAIMYSKKGAYKFLCEVARRGIDMPVDCFVHQISNLDHFNKYAPHPEAPRFCEIDWKAPTTIHHTEVIDAYRVYGAGRYE